MGIQTQSALVAAILLVALGINVASIERRVAHRAAFIGWVAAFFCYNLSVFLASLVLGEFWPRMVIVSAVLIAQSSLRFFERYLDRSMGAELMVVNIGSFVCLALVATDFASSPGTAALAGLLAIGAFGWCVQLLHARYRSIRSKVEATRLLYLVIGGVIAVSSSALDLLSLAGITFPAFGHLTTTLYLFLWMQVVQRSRLLDLKEFLGRGLALVVQTLAVAVIFTALTGWTSQFGSFFFNAALTAVVLFFTFEPLKRLVERWVHRLLFRETFELEVQLTRLRRELTNVLTLGELVDRILSRLQASRRVTHASVFLLEPQGRHYFTTRSIGHVDHAELGVVKHRAFLDALRSELALSREQLDRDLEDTRSAGPADAQSSRLQDVRATMRGLTTSHSFAFVAGERLVGFLNVHDDRTTEAFSSHELGLISALTAQAAAVIENSEIVERLKERDRLSYIGEMATGMAHEIRNPLGAIKGAGQLLDPELMDAEQREFVEVIVDEANRLNDVLAQFLDYARPYRGRLEPLAINRVVERVATLTRAQPWEVKIEVLLNLTEGLPNVMGDGAQLQQVCLNLARNACQSMEASGPGTLTLATRLVRVGIPGRPGKHTTRIEVRIADTGPGIPQEIMASLFIPFFTTKGTGTGLGLAISQRLVQHHGGELRLESVEGEGAVARFTLDPVGEDSLSGEHRRILATETE